MSQPLTLHPVASFLFFKPFSTWMYHFFLYILPEQHHTNMCWGLLFVNDILQLLLLLTTGIPIEGTVFFNVL